MHFLNEIDKAVFYFLNVSLANPLFDWLMPLVTNKITWVPLWLVLIIGLLWKGGKKGRWVLLLAVLAVASADITVSRLLKPLFGRIRPCNALQDVHLLVKKSRAFSMPSAHAANFFALAAVFSYFFRKYQLIFWLLASLVAYSRVAVGVHYPLDVLAGAFCGALLAGLWIFIFKRWQLNRNPHLQSELFS